MIIVPTYANQEQVRNPGYSAVVAIITGLAAFGNFSVSSLLAVLSVVAGIIGIIFSIKKRRWIILIFNVGGFICGATALILMIAGEIPAS